MTVIVFVAGLEDRTVHVGELTEISAVILKSIEKSPGEVQ